MDYIPNEILLPIIGCLPEEEIPKMRLVSNRFNVLATECVQKSCLVKLTTDSDIAKFVTMFEKKAVVPFQKFVFTETVLAYGQPLEQFCLQFGKLVKRWDIFRSSRQEVLGENSVSKNILILLENCVNVEEIRYRIAFVKQKNDEIGKFNNIPTLGNLKTIVIGWLDVENKEFLLLLHQIYQKAPNLRTVEIRNLIDHSWSVAYLANTLNQLANMNATVQLQELDSSLVLPTTNVGDLEKLFPISTQFGIVDLRLELTVRHRDPEQLPQQLEILSKWNQKLSSVRTLSMSYHDMYDPNNRERPNVPIPLPLHAVPNLECLKLKVINVEVYIPVDVDQQTEFPALKSLICNLLQAKANNFIFSGCLFPNVKVAQIDFSTEEECEQWPRVIPNVEELFVITKTLKGIFRFPKLRKLDISFYTGLNRPDYRQVCRQHWTHLTGGAEYIAEGTRNRRLPVNTPEKSESIESFRNLPLLTHLRFTDETAECWKGIVYASRTGQLGRLRKLTFNFRDFDEEESYVAELLKYHDVLVVGDENDDLSDS